MKTYMILQVNKSVSVNSSDYKSFMKLVQSENAVEALKLDRYLEENVDKIYNQDDQLNQNLDYAYVDLCRNRKEVICLEAVKVPSYFGTFETEKV